MQQFHRYELTEAIGKEELSVNVGGRRKQIKATVNVFRFIDKDTKQYVLYIPSFEMSGYGETPKKAEEMIEFVIKDWLTYLKDLPVEKIQKELSNLGWKKSGLFNEQYSHTYVDDEGKVKEMNADNDTIERLSLTAA